MDFKTEKIEIKLLLKLRQISEVFKVEIPQVDTCKNLKF